MLLIVKIYEIVLIFEIDSLSCNILIFGGEGERGHFKSKQWLPWIFKAVFRSDRYFV